MRKPQGSAHLRTVFDQPYVSAAQPYVTACLLAVGLTPVKRGGHRFFDFSLNFSIAPPTSYKCAFPKWNVL